MKTTQHTLEGDVALLRGHKHRNGNVLDGNKHEDDPFPRDLTGAEKEDALNLTDIEKKQWRQALNTIEKGWKTFVDVGMALKLIRSSRLYREDYASWAAFCDEVLGISKTEANRQIIDAEVIETLRATPFGVTSDETETLPMPSNRAQARELAKVKDADKRRQIWGELVAKSGEKEITARNIAEAVKPAKLTPSEASEESSGCDSGEMPSAELDVLKALTVARDKKDWNLVDEVIDHLQHTSAR